eukprot:TRINITY_DN50970_c0_g1_i1.p1 TRINITY_DN50970_c0_g1~~TRINITY_DN50970_c0_g1_i1.p1  ORF type:complete len:315 (+),score=69.62 TRINITY_DN50970_c0_g1_i1:84-1028(+)
MRLHLAYGAVAHAAAAGDFKVQDKPQRFRFNLYSPFLCLLLPLGFFISMFWVHSFKVRYVHPVFTMISSAVGLLIVSCLGLMTIDRWRRFQSGLDQRQPSWVAFLFLTCSAAFFLGVGVGEYNFQANMKPFYDVDNLNSYTDVDPVSARGEQLMDAGRIVFTEGTHLDVEHSMGFMSDQVYCVAPITTRRLDGNSSGLAILDFWAIGKNCCKGSLGGDFHCGENVHLNKHGGLRLLKDSDHTFYRLAVQQAEAAYGIKALHPIFLYWMDDPIAEVEAYETSGKRLFLQSVIGFFVAQLVCVLFALLMISKLARI